MVELLIQMHRGFDIWDDRASGTVDATVDQAIEELLRHAARGDDHRLFLDGKLVATAFRPHGRRGRTKLVRHDG